MVKQTSNMSACVLCRIHQVGLLVTKDKADKGWFLVAVQGAADNMIG
jgi:hypothetical protein